MALKKYISLLHIFFFTLFAVSVSHAKHADDPTDNEGNPPVLEENIPDNTPQDAPGASHSPDIAGVQEDIFQEMLTFRDSLLRNFTPELLRASLAEKLSDDELKNLSYHEWSQYAEAIFDEIEERKTSPEIEEAEDADVPESDPENPPLSSAPDKPNTDGDVGPMTLEEIHTRIQEYKPQALTTLTEDITTIYQNHLTLEENIKLLVYAGIEEKIAKILGNIPEDLKILFLQQAEQAIKIVSTIRGIEKVDTPKNMQDNVNHAVQQLQDDMLNYITEKYSPFLTDFETLQGFVWISAKQHKQYRTNSLPESVAQSFGEKLQDEIERLIENNWKPSWDNTFADMKDAPPETLLAVFNDFVPQVQEDAKVFIDSEYRKFLQDENTVIKIIWHDIEDTKNTILQKAPEALRQAIDQEFEKSQLNGFIQTQWKALHKPKETSNPEEGQQNDSDPQSENVGPQNEDISVEEFLSIFWKDVQQVSDMMKTYMNDKYEELLIVHENQLEHAVEMIWSVVDPQRTTIIESAPEDIRDAFAQAVEKSYLIEYITQAWKENTTPKETLVDLENARAQVVSQTVNHIQEILDRLTQEKEEKEQEELEELIKLENMTDEELEAEFLANGENWYTWSQCIIHPYSETKHNAIKCTTTPEDYQCKGAPESARICDFKKSKKPQPKTYQLIPEVGDRLGNTPSTIANGASTRNVMIYFKPEPQNGASALHVPIDWSSWYKEPPKETKDLKVYLTNSNTNTTQERTSIQHKKEVYFLIHGAKKAEVKGTCVISRTEFLSHPHFCTDPDTFNDTESTKWKGNVYVSGNLKEKSADRYYVAVLLKDGSIHKAGKFTIYASGKSETDYDGDDSFLENTTPKTSFDATSPFSDFAESLRNGDKKHNIKIQNEPDHDPDGKHIGQYFSTDRIDKKEKSTNHALDFSHKISGDLNQFVNIYISSVAPIENTLGRIEFYYKEKSYSFSIYYFFSPPLSGHIYVTDVNGSKSTSSSPSSIEQAIDPVEDVTLQNVNPLKLNTLQNYQVTPVDNEIGFLAKLTSIHYGFPKPNERNSDTLKTKMQDQFEIFRYKIIKSPLEITFFDMDIAREELQKAVKMKLENPKIDTCVQPGLVIRGRKSCLKYEKRRPLTPIDPRTRVESKAIVSYPITNTHGTPKTRVVRYYLDTILPTPTGGSSGTIYTKQSTTEYGIDIKGSVQGNQDTALALSRDMLTNISKSQQRQQLSTAIKKNIQSLSTARVIDGVKYIDGANWQLSKAGDFPREYHTVVVKNGNIIIDKDISKSSQLYTFIALADGYNVTSKNHIGNIYVTPTVKEINAILYAEGGLMSAKEVDVGSIGKKYIPIDTTDTERKTTLGHQLRITGTLFTRNTIGGFMTVGAVHSLPGEKTTTNKDLAIIYDLNYLRTGIGCNPDVDANCPPESPTILEYDPRIIQNPPKIFLAK